MNDFDRQQGAIDDPGMKGGLEPDQRTLPPGDTAGNTGSPGEPSAAELDLPGPDDPVAWSYVERGAAVVDRDGQPIGRVEAMLGTEDGIFHGVAVQTPGHGIRVIPADAVTHITPARLRVAVAASTIGDAEEYQPPEG